MFSPFSKKFLGPFWAMFHLALFKFSNQHLAQLAVLIFFPQCEDSKANVNGKNMCFVTQNAMMPVSSSKPVLPTNVCATGTISHQLTENIDNLFGKMLLAAMGFGCSEINCLLPPILPC